MRRREFIAGLGGAVALSLSARAQQQATPVIGFLGGESPATEAWRVAAVREGLQQAGFAEGRNLAIEYRWAEGQGDRLPALAADLVRRQVSVIAALSGVRSALAAKAATTTIPVVFITGGDPVKLGLVASLNRPDGNLTGIAGLGNELVGKQLGEIRELLPKAETIGFLVNPNNPNTDLDTTQLRMAAQRIGLRLELFLTRGERDFDSVFAALVQPKVGGLLVENDPLFNNRIEQLAALATQHAIPAIHAQREFALAGGLMSYGPSIAGTFREMGNYVGRILKGERPADLPVVRPTKFELVINLKTAKALGLTVPESLLATADELIR
jgi:putative tryptophan/tyrosine transport system substrate-binding protein